MSVCRDCGRPVDWGVDQDGKRIPLEPRATIYRIGAWDPGTRLFSITRVREGYRLLHPMVCPGRRSEPRGTPRPDLRARAGGDGIRAGGDRDPKAARAGGDGSGARHDREPPEDRACGDGVGAGDVRGPRGTPRPDHQARAGGDR